ncbi:MAG: KH domain-containing protein [Chloroflexi bacterium]|nr:MAG: KH domain-containing protein [Chloroflexota bacterium]
MNDKRATLEVIAPTVEEAVEKGLADLGLTPDAVEVEILDQGSKGLFGIGSRHARVRLAVKSGPGEMVSAPVRAEPQAKPAVQMEAEPPYKPVDTETKVITEGDDESLIVARETVAELLERMKVKASVEAHYGKSDEHSTRVPIMVDVYGDDLSILIGRRAETLNALQYISALIVSKELGHSVTVIVDVEGYRNRRENQIKQLARKMAEQAVKTGRRQILEPMPANERRIIHMELRENPAVKTESIGEEPRRKVTIIPIE